MTGGLTASEREEKDGRLRKPCEYHVRKGLLNGATTAWKWWVKPTGLRVKEIN